MSLTVELAVEHTRHVETIQVVLDEALLRAADKMAARLKVNRSALFREALKAYLREAREREREAADRGGYSRKPESASELAAWDGVAAWPED